MLTCKKHGLILIQGDTGNRELKELRVAVHQFDATKIKIKRNKGRELGKKYETIANQIFE